MNQLMQLLATGSGVALYCDGRRMFFVDRGTGPAYTACFVLGLLTGILGLAGLSFVLLALLRDQLPIAIGAVVLALAAALGLGLAQVVRYIRRRNAESPGELPKVAVVDLESGWFCDGAGRPAARLSTVRITRRMQLGSSSPALVAVVGTHTVVLARGNPFGGGIGALEGALRERGLMR